RGHPPEQGGGRLEKWVRHRFSEKRCLTHFSPAPRSHAAFDSVGRATILAFEFGGREDDYNNELEALSRAGGGRRARPQCRAGLVDHRRTDGSRTRRLPAALRDVSRRGPA